MKVKRVIENHSPNNEMECACVITNKVLGISQYMFTWLEHLDNTKKDMQIIRKMARK